MAGFACRFTKKGPSRCHVAARLPTVYNNRMSKRPQSPKRFAIGIGDAAKDALMDRTLFVVSPKVHAEFLARLDAPPKPNARLLRTLKTPLPWK